jgi:hypothetical protein
MHCSQPVTRHRRWRFASLLVLTFLASATSAGHPAVGQDARRDGRSELILSNLPPKGSKLYKDLLGLAGKTANGQVLGFTQSEMWSMPTSRIEGVIRHGKTLGVKMTRLSADWNQVLKAPAAPMTMSPPQEAVMKAMSGSKQTTHVGVMASPNAALVEYALMKDHDPKSAIGRRPVALISKIVLPLKDEESITVRRTGIDVKKDGFTWRGEIEGTGEPVLLMWWRNGRFNGMFTYRGRMYSLINMGVEVHAVVETDPGKMPPDHGAMPARTQSADVKDDPLVARGEGAIMRAQDRPDVKDRQDSIGGAAQKVETVPDSLQPTITPLPAAKRSAMAAKNITIDLMVLYTPKVIAKYIDVDKDLIALSIEQANQSMQNSGLGKIRLRLVHSQLIDYDETDGEHLNHLYHMVDAAGPFKGIPKLRNEKRADVVALIVDDPSGCGLSTRVGADADEAFVVVHHSCAALTYSIAHEVGHIIGARHDIALDKNVTPFPYGHGFVNGTKWRDIMSYKASCDGCPRVPIWSNPAIKFKGDPAGTVDADNARVILEQAERVSNFR